MSTVVEISSEAVPALQGKNQSDMRAAFLAELRSELHQLRLAAVSIECIGLAVRKGVFDIFTAAKAFCALPKLRSEPDPYVEMFCALVEEKRAEYEAGQKRRQKWRRSA